MNNNTYRLDQILAHDGADRLKKVFYGIAVRDRPLAAELLSDNSLVFPVLWTLIPEIDALDLSHELSPRSRAAIQISLMKIKNSSEKTHPVPMPNGPFRAETVHAAAKWMIDTGKDWTLPAGRADPFEAVVDYAAALLIIIFRDDTVLPDIVRLIFKRNRQGRYIHDLVWAFFQTLNTDALRLISDYLLSPDSRDVKLAASLLPLDDAVPAMGTDMRRPAEPARQHASFDAWLSDNSPYLFLTGEQFQQSSAPRHFDCDSEAKYLGKAISPRDRTPAEPLTETERDILTRYRALPEPDQALLASFSYALRSEDQGRWEKWRRMEAANQVMAAKNGFEVL